MGRVGVATMVAAVALGGSATEPPSDSGSQSPAAAPASGRELLLLDQLFRGGALGAEHLAPAFLAQISATTLAEIVAGLQQRHGAFRGLAVDGSAFTVHLDRADVPTLLALDNQDRITGLLFQPPVPTAGDLDGYVRDIAVLPGRTAVLVTTAGQVRTEHRAELPLAVGSAFKLAVLRAVAEAVAGGQLAWDHVVRLDPAQRSLPSGILQDWAEGAPLTVATLANLMISISDNTAADALIHLVGREAIEAGSPRNAPFLTTREAWVLKGAGNAALRRDWLAANAAGRRALLGAVDALPLPDVREMTPEVTSDVEWFFTARELCALLDGTRDLPMFRISPGPVERGRWRNIAYKGGSEAGVLALAASVVAESDARHCVVAIWNGDDTLDDRRLVEPFNGILRALSDAK